MAQRFDTQSFFLLQPVVEAWINGDQLILPAPVNGANSDRLLDRREDGGGGGIKQQP